MAFKTAADTPRYRTVLLARFSALGDVAMTVPSVYSACRRYPEVRFVFITRTSMTSIFVDPPENLVLEGVDLKGEYEGTGGLIRLARHLVATYSPDIFVDLHNVLRTKVISAYLLLKGISTVRIVKPRSKRRALTRRHNKVLLPLKSQLERYREAFAASGLESDDSFEGLYCGQGKADTADFAAITEPKKPGEKWVGIAPFAAHQGKIYPPELMEKVVARLQEEYGGRLRIFLFGGGDHEKAVLEQWQERYPCAQSLAGKRYGFKAELALLNHIDVAVTMDSANMHLAALAGTPTVSVWGATHPYCGFRGWRQKEELTVQLPMDCRPCSVFGNKPCLRGDYLCLAAIKPELILNKVKNYL